MHSGETRNMVKLTAWAGPGPGGPGQSSVGIPSLHYMLCPAIYYPGETINVLTIKLTIRKRQHCTVFCCQESDPHSSSMVHYKVPPHPHHNNTCTQPKHRYRHRHTASTNTTIRRAPEHGIEASTKPHTTTTTMHTTLATMAKPCYMTRHTL